MGKRHTRRDRVVGSNLTLPVVAVVALACWLAPAPSDWRLWAGAGVALLCAYALMELNNRFSLLRVRSRLVSATYLVLSLAVPSLHAFDASVSVPALCLVACYAALLPSYQLLHAEGYAFHAFLCLGVGSMLFPPLLLVVPPLLFSMLVRLRCLSWRVFCAVAIGLLVPYWLYAGYAVWQNRLDTAFLYLAEWLAPGVPDYSGITLPQAVTAGVFFFFSVVATIHFRHTAYNDKIRTRMYFHVFATVELFLWAGLVLLPQHFGSWLSLLALNSSPLVAHYYALGRGRGFGLWFALSFAVMVSLAVFGYLALYGPLSHLESVTPLAGIALW